MAVLFALLLLTQQSEVAVEATLSETTVVAGSSVVLQLRVRTDGARPRIDPLTGLEGLEVTSTRSSDQRQFSLPGGTRRFVSRDYVIIARRPGRYRIPPIGVEVEGRRYRTRPLVLTVEPAAATTAPEDAEQGVALRAWLDTDTAYVGQQVTYHAEALFGSEVRLRLRRAPEYEAPSPSGFWIQELSRSPVGSTRVLGSDIYEVQTFQRALFPITTGRLTIPPARLTFDVRRGLLSAPESRELLTDTLGLLVRPVPERGRPEGYAGAVGRYTVRAWLQPDTVSAGDAVVLAVEVDGTGNVKALPRPELPDLDGVEVFPPSEDASVRVTGGVVGGSKRFEWVLVPGEAGRLEVPVLRYPYFDPERRRYDVAVSRPLTVHVGPGAVAGDRPPERLRFLKLEPAGRPFGWVLTPVWGAVQVLPVALLLLVLARRDLASRRPSRRALRRAREATLARLREQATADGPAFFGDLADGIRRWLADRLDAPELRRAAPQAVARALDEAGVDAETTRGAAELLARLARARYEPDPPGRETRMVFVHAAERLLADIDRALRRRRGRGRGRTVTVVLLVLCIGLPAAPAAQQPDPRFLDGVEAYRDGDVMTALSVFQAYVDRAPDDAAGWYNLGNAYHGAEWEGAAVAAWLRALRLAPRDDDVRTNLRVADADPVLVDRVRPLLPLARGEAWFAASIAWLAGSLLLVLFAARRRRSVGVVGAVLVGVALLLAAEILARDIGPDLVVVPTATTLRAAPNLRGESVHDLEPGSGLEVVSRHDGWLRLRTFSGREGWIEASRVVEL